MIKFFILIILFFIFTFPLSTTGNINETKLFKCAFLVYNDTVFTYFHNKVFINKIILIQRVICIFYNGNILLNDIVVAFNESSYFCPSLSIRNSSHPLGMFYISPNLLGKNISCNNLFFNGTTTSGLYIYYRCTQFLGAKNKLTLYFNSSGIAISGIDVQCECGINESIAYYKLWRTNIIANESLPSFPGYTLASKLTYNFSSAFQREAELHNILSGILSLGLSIIIIILVFRPKTECDSNGKRAL